MKIQQKLKTYVWKCLPFWEDKLDLIRQQLKQNHICFECRGISITIHYSENKITPFFDRIPDYGRLNSWAGAELFFY
jgi:hypothetical protein